MESSEKQFHHTDSGIFKVETFNPDLQEQNNQTFQRDFKGVWIPKEIWLNKELDWIEKLLLTEIDSLDNENGCYATNEYFMMFFNLPERKIQRLIKSLYEKKYITRTFEKDGFKINKRIIKINKQKLYGRQNCRRADDKIVARRTTDLSFINNTINNTINIYGSLLNVHLSQNDYDRLVGDYGLKIINKYIESLSLYIGGLNKDPYKNHNLAIRKWLNKDDIPKAEKQPVYIPSKEKPEV